MKSKKTSGGFSFNSYYTEVKKKKIFKLQNCVMTVAYSDHTINIRQSDVE